MGQHDDKKRLDLWESFAEAVQCNSWNYVPCDRCTGTEYISKPCFYPGVRLDVIIFFDNEKHLTSRTWIGQAELWIA